MLKGIALYQEGLFSRESCCMQFMQYLEDWNGTVLKSLIVKFHEPVGCPVGPLVELGDLDSMK